jgi:hypothetical protein
MAMDDFELRETQEALVHLKLEKLRRLEMESELRRRLPHKYAGKFYPWQRDWMDCSEKIQCLTAANQVGKSTTMIKKVIEWATNKDLWPKLWPAAMKEGKYPNVFWYLYPTKEMCTQEFFDKWVPLLPPREDPVYGWESDKLNKFISSLTFIHFGVTIYFKTYAQGAEMMQAGTSYAVFCDEELYEELVPELFARLAATDGYFITGFTATIGLPFWKQVVEDRTKWKNAWIRQISLYDCQRFEDGSPTMWTDARIQSRIDQCASKQEILRRVFGKFVKDEGLRYPTFDRARHVKPYLDVPQDWPVFVGIDYGSGGVGGGHPSSIVCVAANPQMTELRMMRSWRGDGVQTTAEDVVDIYLEIRNSFKNEVMVVSYDYSAADVGTIAARRGLPFHKADKSRERGIPILNALFKTGALTCDEPSDVSREQGIPDEWLSAMKLSAELESLGVSQVKTAYGVIDDLSDALRYAIMKMPLQWEKAGSNATASAAQKIYSDDELRRNPELMYDKDEQLSIDAELSFWDEVIND